MRKKLSLQFFVALFTALFASGLMQVNAQTVVNWNINTQGDLNIPGASTNYYYVTGTGTVTANRIIIESGYQGTITLDNVQIRAAANYAAIRVKGNGNATSPSSKVTFILKGYNQLETGAGPAIKGADVDIQSDAAALQVDQGSQIHIRAIDENDNNSGELVARCYHDADGGAGIGGPDSNAGVTSGDVGPQGTVTSWGPAQTGSMYTSGGNVIISSGTIWTRGGRCGAGIGSGYRTIFSGNIVIYGGDVTAYGGNHSAGIGTGCPAGSGNNGWYAFTSSIIALPPAKIVATTEQPGRLGLAGANSITYVGDPESPLITVRTVDNEQNADIYADISETVSVVTVFNALGITSTDYDLTNVKFGNTGSSGQFQFRATFAQNVTFFTDASSSQPATWGRPYKPVVTTVTAVQTVILPLLDIGMAFEVTPATPMLPGYTASEALTNSYMLKVTYTDSKPMTGITYDLQKVADPGSTSDFTGLLFYNANPDGSIGGAMGSSGPTSLSAGDVFYVRVPILQGKLIGIYQDVLRMSGTFDGGWTGYIRQVVTQRIVYDDTSTNTYIKVTANPQTYETDDIVSPPGVALSLNITHGTLDVAYNATDVTARYLITTYPDYDDAIADTPLSSWTALNVPATDGGSAITTASLAGKPAGVYYIHWYVTSGVVYAHSLTVVSPVATYGGFGPYVLDMTPPTAALTVDGESATKAITTLAALPVTLTFNEAILNAATVLTASGFTITPSTAATISGITLVSGSNRAYTATLTPSNSLANGASFTLQVPANRVTDLAGNGNDASNTVTVTFSQGSSPTRPAVTFNNAATYASLTPSFTVTVDPADFGINLNEDLYTTAGGAAISTGASLASLFTITPASGSALTTGYYAQYTKTGTGAAATHVITVSFDPGTLLNSTEYTIAIGANSLYNRLQNGNIAGSSTFKIAMPDFTDTDAGITASPNLFTDAGGTTDITIRGKGLKMNADGGILSLEVRCPTLGGSGYTSALIGSVALSTGSDGWDVATITGVPIPANTTNATQTYTFTLYMDFNSSGMISTGKTAIVQVEPATSYIVEVTNETTSVSNLIVGYTSAQAQLNSQTIKVTNKGVQTLTGLTVSFTGTDATAFTNTAPSLLVLDPNQSATFTVYLVQDKNAGTYAGPSRITNVMVSAYPGSASTALNGTAALVAQTVIARATRDDGSEGIVTGNPAPSNTWSNQDNVQLTATVLGTGDYLIEWKYAVVSTNSRPIDSSTDWVTVSGGTNTATYTFPSGTDQAWYIFWGMTTNDVTGIQGQVVDGTVSNYLIDLIAPTVTSITPDRTITNATPFKATVVFSEEVGTIDASKFVASNATVTDVSPVTSSGSAGLYTTYEMTIAPSSTLTDGSSIVITVTANAAKDKAGNNSLAAAGSLERSVLFNSVNPLVTLTTPNLKTNANFVVTATFSKQIFGLLESHFYLTNGATIVSGSLMPVGGSDVSYTFTVNTSGLPSGNILVELPNGMVADAAGNTNESGSLVVDFKNPNDRIAAVLTYSSTTYQNGPFDVLVTFTRNVTGLSASHFVYNTTDLTATLSGSGMNYILTLTPLTGREGTTSVSMPAGTSVRDEYDNELNASNTVSANYDTRRPLVQSIYMVDPVSEVNFDPFDVKIVFDEAGCVSFDATKLDLGILELVSVVSGPVTVGSTTEVVIRVRVPEDSPSGSTIGIKVEEGAVKDKATNPNTAGSVIGLTNWSTSGGGTGTPGTGTPVVFIDNVVPFVVSMSPSGMFAPIKGQLIITFNKTINQSAGGNVWLQTVGYLTNGTWLDKRTLSFPYGYLAYWATYNVYVTGFQDLAGNLQDPDFHGVFSTGAPVRPTYQREIILFVGAGVELSVNPNMIHHVQSAQDFVFNVIAKPGYSLEKLTVTTGNPARDRDGVILTKNADGSVTVQILRVQETSFITVSLGDVANEVIEPTKVWSHEQMLYVETTQLASLSIYTMAGELYKRMPVYEGITTVPLPRGAYTVVVDGKGVFKVIVQ